MNTPWTASTDGEWWDVVGQDGATIARFRGNQHESLARLIAAAPELLQALSVILGGSGGAKLVSEGAVTLNDVRLARAAIDKATGAA